MFSRYDLNLAKGTHINVYNNITFYNNINYNLYTYKYKMFVDIKKQT